MSVDLKIEGLEQLQGQLERKRLGFMAATRKATLAEATEIMKESGRQVPKDTETLAKSAFVEQDAEGNVTFGYGKDNLYNAKAKESVQEYMVAVHERLDVHHPNGKAKFLEDPVRAHEHKLENSLAARIKSFLGL